MCLALFGMAACGRRQEAGVYFADGEELTEAVKEYGISYLYVRRMTFSFEDFEGWKFIISFATENQVIEELGALLKV